MGAGQAVLAWCLHVGLLRAEEEAGRPGSACGGGGGGWDMQGRVRARWPAPRSCEEGFVVHTRSRRSPPGVRGARSVCPSAVAAPSRPPGQGKMLNRLRPVFLAGSVYCS